MRRRHVLERGFVLHSIPYKETSLILEVFVREQGRVPLLAKGARRPRSALRGVLLSFQALRISWTSGAEMGLLTGAEWADAYRPLAGLSMMCGFYVNELLLRLVPREDPHERLFDDYDACLGSLSREPESAAVALRRFEGRLLTGLGYAPGFSHDAGTQAPVDAAARYAYDPERGPLLARGEVAGDITVSGQTLLDLARDDFSRVQTRDEARELMRCLIAHRLGGRELNTRAVLKELLDL